MINYKNSNAAKTTITRDVGDLDNNIGNLYEALVIISKRANQISSHIKEELTDKLAEFATTTDNLEEIFENREQIEISKYYEQLPKATAVAVDEMLEGQIYWRRPEVEEAPAAPVEEGRS